MKTEYFLFFLILLVGCRETRIAYYTEDERPPPRCGDGHCDDIEIGLCTEDCIICGDKFCDQTEDRTTCPIDCYECGDGICDYDEMGWCISDCHNCVNYFGNLVPCHAENCGERLQYCDVCGDDVCSSDRERIIGCPECWETECGDDSCNYWEWGTCPEDCPQLCGDRHCSDYEEATGICPQDCAICGDGICEQGEQNFCLIDCRPN